MSTRVLSALLAVFVFAFSGCAPIMIDSPGGKAVRLAPSGTETPREFRFRTWYMFWGFMPLGEINTAQKIQESGYNVIRIETKAMLDDMIISLLGVVPLVPFSRTVIIYGEPASEPAPEKK